MLAVMAKIVIQPPHSHGNPVPGGMTITSDGKRLYVAAANRNAVVEIDLDRRERTREFRVENLPFEAELCDDERTLIVSNWGGRIGRPDDTVSWSQNLKVVVDQRNTSVSGTVSLINLRSGGTAPGGWPPPDGDRRGWQACLRGQRDERLDLRDQPRDPPSDPHDPAPLGPLRVLGGMPNALAIRGRTLYVANGGDNAVCEMDLDAGLVLGYRPRWLLPHGHRVEPGREVGLVLNTKGNGSVSNTLLGKPGNAHDFQGTVTVVDLTADLARETALVARNNRWDANRPHPA